MCSVASEEIRQEEWGIDVVMTATQKGLGTPPGLSLLVASQRAIKVVPAITHKLLNAKINHNDFQVFESRSAPVASYYASWKKCVQS